MNRSGLVFAVVVLAGTTFAAQKTAAPTPAATAVTFSVFEAGIPEM